MSESIYDLAREAELLKSSLKLHDTSSTLDSSTTDVWSCRQKLEEIYKQMLLLDLHVSLESRVEVDLWNCVFRTQIASLQTNISHQQGIQRDETFATLCLFLESASCFYYQLLQSILYKYNSSLPSFLTPEQIGVCRGLAGTSTAGEDEIRVIGQDCLLRMGDIARYKGECSLASKYYTQAENLLPGRGIVSNQMGLIASTQGNFYKAAFHYSHTIISRSPFSLSRNNLEQIFETHARQFPAQITDILSFQIGLLYLISILYFSKDLSFFSFLLSKLTVSLSSLLQTEVKHEFILSTVGLCLFACVISYQPLNGITLQQAKDCITPEEHQRCKLALLLLLETTLILVSRTQFMTPPILNTMLPFITVILHWITSHLQHIPVEQLTQIPSLWQGIADTVNRLCLKSGFETGIDISQCLSEETALIEFLCCKHKTTDNCTREELCLAKLIYHIRHIIQDTQCNFLSLNTRDGIYQLVYTSPANSPNVPLEQDAMTSPTLSPLFSSPLLNNSNDYSFFPTIWSDTTCQQTSPLLATPTLTPVDTIHSIWNVSDPASP